jgi:tetratricopeptide (TPR) repeat protein
VQEPDKWLDWLNEHLSYNGLLYIALPTLDRLDYPSIDNLFKDEHINWFTDNTLKQFLALKGFEPVFENNYTYGTTLICKKVNPKEKLNNYLKENLEKLTRITEVYRLKDAMDKSHNPKEIIAIMNQALAIYPKFPEIVAKGISIMETIDAIDFLETYLKTNPDMPMLKLQLALTYYRDEQFDKAKELFLDAIKEDGIIEMALSHLIFISIQQGEIKEALGYLKTIMKEYPLNLQHYEILANVLIKL